MRGVGRGQGVAQVARQSSADHAAVEHHDGAAERRAERAVVVDELLVREVQPGALELPHDAALREPRQGVECGQSPPENANSA